MKPNRQLAVLALDPHTCHNPDVPHFVGTTGVAIMEPLDVFTVRDLRQRSGDLLRDAEQGRLALITKHGRPAILAVPFDERLLSHGIHRAVALHLFEAEQVTLAQAARLAGLPLEGFIELLGQTGIAAVSYPAEDLAEEVEAAR
jgi:prevent-host-death family protein